MVGMPDQLAGLMPEAMVKLELHFELANSPMMEDLCGSLVVVELLPVLILMMN